MHANFAVLMPPSWLPILHRQFCLSGSYIVAGIGHFPCEPYFGTNTRTLNPLVIGMVTGTGCANSRMSHFVNQEHGKARHGK